PEAVDDARLARGVVAEHEEVVAQELELDGRVLDAHRLHLEPLALDHAGRLLVRLRRRPRRFGLRVGETVAAAAVAVAGRLALELVGRTVARGVPVPRALPDAKAGPLPPPRDLRAPARPDAPGALHRDTPPPLGRLGPP